MGAFSCDMSLSDWRPMEVQSCLATKNLPGRMLRLAGLLSNQESSSQEIFASCKSDSIRSQVAEKLCFITQTDAKGKGGNGDVALGEATGTNHLQPERRYYRTS